MPKAKEFTVTVEDKPGALGKFFQQLADHGLNVLAFQSFVEGPESLTRLIVDDPAKAKTLLGTMGVIFEETDAVVVKVPHRPGEMARAARRLGEAGVNVDYSYCGFEPGSFDDVLLVFGVDSLSKAATLLDGL